MANSETCTWRGDSGTEYTYFIYSLPVNFDPNQNGNYIFSKKNDAGKWVPIYIGEGDLAERANDNHHQAVGIARKGATHVHVHLNANKANRRAEEEDLLAHYTNAYAPSGCNEKKGG